MKHKQADRLLVFGFVAVLFAIAGLFLLLPIRSFSDTENRVLQRAPQFTWDNLWSKKLAEETELFVTDHFPYRDQWVAVKSEAEQARLQQENNGIYKGKDGYLFEKFGKPDEAALQADTDAVKQFALRHPEAHMTFLLAPTSIGLYPNRLPWLASAYPEAQVNAEIGERLQDSLTYLNGFDILQPHAADKRPIDYRTDHHWTTYGAYLAYAAYAKQAGWTPKPESDFRIQTVTTDFLGSYQTRSQFSGMKPDSIQIYIPKKPVSSSVYVADTDTTSDSLYDPAFLGKKDKYSYFLGGVHALMKINSHPAAEDVTQQKLLVIKDSYAHSVIPFLALHVPEIHVIDLRYYSGDIGAYMAENGIQDVLLLFNTVTFLENGSSVLSSLR